MLMLDQRKLRDIGSDTFTVHRLITWHHLRAHEQCPPTRLPRSAVVVVAAAVVAVAVAVAGDADAVLPQARSVRSS